MTTEKAMFGAGCFWGVEATFRNVQGVKDVAVGYAGGSKPNPSYEDVCTDETGHAEVVHVEFDPMQVSYEQLLHTFFVNHDPTTLNRQGADVGTQYRSVVFYYTPEQKAAAEKAKAELDASGKFRRPIVTQIEPAPQFYRGEEYHQRYLEKRGLSHCAIYICKPEQMMNVQVVRTNEFVTDAAEFIIQTARAALGERGEFRIALSGGNTPRPVYEELARRAPELPWERIFVTFGDERCVPPEHEKSNYRMARESLFSPAAVPDRSIARMRGAIDPRIAANEYQDQLDVLAAQKGEAIYRHDLILLGLGPDGHTASLFPGTAALEENARRVVANFVPQLNEWRLTFTYPLIAAARKICFLVDGTKHAELIEAVLAGEQQYPAARVANPGGETTWMIGTAA